MAITATHLTTNNVAAADPQVTASISPSANKLVLLWLRIGDDSTTVVSVPGNGLTWVQVRRDVTAGGNTLELYRAMGSAPTAGAVTIDLSASVLVAWTIAEFGEVDTGGTNGSAAVVQTATNQANPVNNLTVTLGAFSSADNATAGGFFYSASALRTITVGTGFTELGNVSTDTLGGACSEFKTTNDTTVDWSVSGAATYLSAIAIEIKSATTVIANIPTLLYMGVG